MVTSRSNLSLFLLLPSSCFPSAPVSQPRRGFRVLSVCSVSSEAQGLLFTTPVIVKTPKRVIINWVETQAVVPVLNEEKTPFPISSYVDFLYAQLQSTNTQISSRSMPPHPYSFPLHIYPVLKDSFPSSSHSPLPLPNSPYTTVQKMQSGSSTSCNVKHGWEGRGPGQWELNVCDAFFFLLNRLNMNYYKTYIS